ncbi:MULTISPECIES: NlpC/P60 family protein [unclassified Sphingomonas]|uniref:NlpC/P60 family protein n=1 Tax=unclassified Sphingomonas TaxID=196159 RepID=UPI00031612E1|nr:MULTISPECIES: TIGR02594 family protein [unclassified Sphingomonas]
MKKSIKAIQQALAERGFSPGEVDGVWGRKSIAALRAFQQSQGLEADGVLGPKTAAALFPNDGQEQQRLSPALVWFEEARRQFGTAEVPGPASNAKILQWATARGIPYRGDDIPWCGLFVAHCIGSTLIGEPLPINPLGARNWARFGIASQPRLGAVMVFWRGSRDGVYGHVGFYAGEDATAYHILGGNQSDSVSVARIARDRLLAARWPISARTIETGRVEVAAGANALSVNEA